MKSEDLRRIIIKNNVTPFITHLLAFFEQRSIDFSLHIQSVKFLQKSVVLPFSTKIHCNHISSGNNSNVDCGEHKRSIYAHKMSMEALWYSQRFFIKIRNWFSGSRSRQKSDSLYHMKYFGFIDVNQTVALISEWAREQYFVESVTNTHSILMHFPC